MHGCRLPRGSLNASPAHIVCRAARPRGMHGDWGDGRAGRLELETELAGGVTSVTYPATPLRFTTRLLRGRARSMLPDRVAPHANQGRTPRAPPLDPCPEPSAREAPVRRAVSLLRPVRHPASPPPPLSRARRVPPPSSAHGLTHLAAQLSCLNVLTCQETQSLSRVCLCFLEPAEGSRDGQGGKSPWPLIAASRQGRESRRARGTAPARRPSVSSDSTPPPSLLAASPKAACPASIVSLCPSVSGGLVTSSGDEPNSFRWGESL